MVKQDTNLGTKPLQPSYQWQRERSDKAKGTQDQLINSAQNKQTNRTKITLSHRTKQEQNSIQLRRSHLAPIGQGKPFHFFHQQYLTASAARSVIISAKKQID
ncbi:hypothetical protein PGT21_006777 [Puccinia graminis f. sp. tritici]|uniref:Uncharacterized protein n=1 Tax=Puccinia graminis f. sp. tritici TaxID=56615 RepID=A0A5B0MQU5_PUCGR|nr:hypothetical protein PGT21_006777 [Puccinia graminis f. sp. tritici]